MAQAPSRVADAGFPPLTNGDLLTREEFERRWDLHPEIKKAELIGGIVYLKERVPPSHGEPHGCLGAWLGIYGVDRETVQALMSVTVRLAEDDLSPDCVLRVHGGTSSETETAIEGPPELIAEVAPSSAAYDLHLKKDIYRRNGVREYLAWQVWDRRVDWWELRDGQYVSIEPDADGIIESRVFPGLRLHVPKLLEGDLASVLAELAPRA